MTTFKFQCSSLLLSKLIRVQSKLDNQVYKEMIGQVLWSQLPSDCKTIGLEKQHKNPTYNAFYASKLQEYVEEGLLFQNISKSKNYPCWPWSPISSHNTKLGHATFCWFCDAGSHMHWAGSSTQPADCRVSTQTNTQQCSLIHLPRKEHLRYPKVTRTAKAKSNLNLLLKSQKSVFLNSHFNLCYLVAYGYL